MSWVDGSVIGGPHHGQRLPIERRRNGDLCRAPIFEHMLMPAPMSCIEVTMMTDALQQLALYRLCTARCGSNSFRFWIPASVSNDDELGHVLRIALGGSVF